MRFENVILYREAYTSEAKSSNLFQKRSLDLSVVNAE